MKEYLTANEALQVAAEAQQEKLEVDFAYVMSQIESKAKEGHTICWINKILSSGVQAKVKELGYYSRTKVSTITGDYITEITWETPL